MTTSQVFESPQHIQYFLAILQGYSSRIAAHQSSAQSLSDENRQLREKAEEIRGQNRDASAGLEMQNKLIRCQEEHITLLEGYRKASTNYEPLRNWSSIPEPAATDWQIGGPVAAFSSSQPNDAPAQAAEVNAPRTKKRKLNSEDLFDSLENPN